MLYGRPGKKLHTGIFSKKKSSCTAGGLSIIVGYERSSIGPEQVVGNGFPHFGIVALRVAVVIFFPALNAVLARGGGSLAGAGGRK